MSILASMTGALERWSRRLCDLAGWMLAGMAVLINVEVVARYLFNTSTLIADEYAGYLFVWATLLGFGYALQTGQFLRVEAVVLRLRPGGQHLASLAAALAGLVVALVCLDATWGLFTASWRFGTRSIQPSATPLWIPQLLLPIVFAWLSVLYVNAIAVTLAHWRAGGRPATPAAPDREP